MILSISIDNEFDAICRQIEAHNLTPQKWAEIESGDMFQSDHYCGGYDADEKAFCFSYYKSSNEEYWFQLTLSEVQAIVQRAVKEIQMRPAE